MKLLEIKNLSAEADGKKILNGLNLTINSGEINALLGPNASGKSTLAKVIAGLPDYKITRGSILYKGKEIKALPAEKRVKLGIALVFQNPPAIEGIKLGKLLERISVAETRQKEKYGYLLERDVNVNLSGGEKKISELLQVLSLNPKLLILDEIDSGLDINKREEVVKILKKEAKDKKMAVIVITHQGEILKRFNPDKANVIIGGKIACQSRDYKKVLKIIKKNDYAKCKQCKKV